MGKPKFEIFKGKDQQFYFHLKAENGEIILASEGYVSKAGCKNGIESVQVNSVFDSHYQRKDAEGNYTFNLKAGNGEIIGRSENYTTKHAREKGIASVKANAPVAQVLDLTS